MTPPVPLLHSQPHTRCALQTARASAVPLETALKLRDLLQMRRFKYREARHRRTVESTDRRVRRYAVIKLAIVAVIAMCQPLILSQFFKERL